MVLVVLTTYNISSPERKEGDANLSTFLIFLIFDLLETALPGVAGGRVDGLFSEITGDRCIPADEARRLLGAFITSGGTRDSCLRRQKVEDLT